MEVLGMKNTISEVKILLDAIKSRIDPTEVRTSEVEHIRKKQNKQTKLQNEP